jgi:hypothetical protein
VGYAVTTSHSTCDCQLELKMLPGTNTLYYFLTHHMNVIPVAFITI